MTFPTPIAVVKAPRPTELSNLDDPGQPNLKLNFDVPDVLSSTKVLRLSGSFIVEVTSILHGNIVALLRIVDTVAGLHKLSLNSHVDGMTLDISECWKVINAEQIL